MHKNRPGGAARAQLLADHFRAATRFRDRPSPTRLHFPAAPAPPIPRPLVSCTPCPGPFPTRLLSPADSLPSGATPAGVEQRRRAETTTNHPGVPGPGVSWLSHGLFPEPCSHPAPRPHSRAPSHLPTTLHASQRRMRHLLPLGHLPLPAAGPHSGSTEAVPACPSTGVYQPHHAGPPQQVPV